MSKIQYTAGRPIVDDVTVGTPERGDVNRLALLFYPDESRVTMMINASSFTLCQGVTAAQLRELGETALEIAALIERHPEAA